MNNPLNARGILGWHRGPTCRAPLAPFRARRRASVPTTIVPVIPYMSVYAIAVLYLSSIIPKITYALERWHPKHIEASRASREPPYSWVVEGERSQEALQLPS